MPLRICLPLLLLAGMFEFACAEDRIALVIGNANYDGNFKLKNPTNDADAMEAALKKLDFQVTKKTDLTLEQFENAVVAFRRSLKKDSVGLFFYAGHGHQVKGETFLEPLNTRLQDEFQISAKCYPVEQVLSAMDRSEAVLKIVILDCCRNNRFDRGGPEEFAPISNPPDGTIIAFATSPGKEAKDGSGANSPYTKQLAASLARRPPQGLEVTAVIREASQAVKKETGQRPWINFDASLEQYYLWRDDSAVTRPPNAEPAYSVTDRKSDAPQLVLDSDGFFSGTTDLAFSPDGRTLAVAGEKIIRLYSLVTGELLTTLRGYRTRTDGGVVQTVAYSPDGQYLLAGIHDSHARGSIRVYRTADLREIEAVLPGHIAPCKHIAFSRDGKYMASVDTNGQQLIWDWTTRKILTQLPPRDPKSPIIDVMMFPDESPLVFSIDQQGPDLKRAPDGKRAARAEMKPALEGWMYDIFNGKMQWPFGATIESRLVDLRLDRDVWAAAGMGKTPEGNKFWVGVWRARGAGAQTSAQPSFVYSAHKWEVCSLALNSDGDLAASGDKFGNVHVWETRSGRVRQIIKSPGQSYYEAAFDPTEKRIFFGATPDIKNWDRNRYGRLTHEFDLETRVLRKIDPAAERSTVQEVTQRGATKIDLETTAAGPLRLRKLQGDKPVGSYRLPNGRNLSAYTLLDRDSLGCREPVLFSDNQGYLAMWDSSRDELRRYFGGHESMITAISPARNGNVFLTASTDRTLRIWSLRNYIPTGIFDFKYENTTVIEVKPGTSSAQAGVAVGDQIVTVDGKTTAEMYELMVEKSFPYKPGDIVPVTMRRAGRDYTYKMAMAEGFDYQEPILNVYFGERDEWIIWTPAGFYDCSPGADRLIGWHVNREWTQAAEFYQVQQFRKRLYRPDIIDALIKYGDLNDAIAAVEKERPGRTAVAGFTERKIFDAYAPPKVTIESPVAGVAPDQTTFNVSAVVRSTNEQAIKRVSLVHNGVPAKVFTPNPDEGAVFRITDHVTLLPGKNEFAFIADNGGATSAAAEARIEVLGPNGAIKSRVLGLVVGVANYENGGKGFNNLGFAAEDAQAFAALVESQRNNRLYTGVELKVLTNEQATKEAVMDGVQWLVDNAQAGDVVVLFAACHGFADDRGNLFLAGYDVDRAKLRATGISWREVSEALYRDLPACKRVVFLDACNSVTIGKSGMQNPLNELSSPEYGVSWFSSSNFREVSFESPEWKHGAFTEGLLEVVADPTADAQPAGGDGFLTAAELGRGLEQRVQTLTGKKQTPVFYHPAGKSSPLFERARQ